MIPSLRYLCLEKVIAQNDDYSDLPRILVKDINLMKVFNGTYIEETRRVDFLDTIQLKIFYDGKTWNFKSRTWSHESDEEGDDGKGVCFCKYCWETTGLHPIDFTVKEGEVFQAESSFLDFLEISRLEEEDMKISGWKLRVDFESNENKHPFLVKYGEVKSLGAISFHGVGQGEESTIWEKFQVEVVSSPEVEGWFGQTPAREFTYLHRIVTGSHYYSELYSKENDERRHVSWWRDPTSGEIHCGVSLRI